MKQYNLFSGFYLQMLYIKLSYVNVHYGWCWIKIKRVAFTNNATLTGY